MSASNIELQVGDLILVHFTNEFEKRMFEIPFELCIVLKCGRTKTLPWLVLSGAELISLPWWMNYDIVSRM
jgi:hypothetical protein